MWIVPHYQGDEKRGLFIWKSHHSLCDGISSMALYLELDNHYDPTKLIKFPKVSLTSRAILKLMIPISMIQMAYKILTLK